MSLNVGDIAPDFILKDQNEIEYRLSAYRGKQNVVLSFHPLAWTAVCARQMQDLEYNRLEFERMNTLCLGISVDSLYSKRAWADSLNINETALLADFWPQGDMAKKYGVFRHADGFSERAVFIIDKNSIIRFKKIYPITELPDFKEIQNVVMEIL